MTNNNVLEFNPESIMEIYGDKCHNCGQKTRRLYNDKPTCGHCIAILEACHEEIRKCSVDNEEMKKT